MTMLLDGRLRDLATQTHLLETKVSSLGWIPGDGRNGTRSWVLATHDGDSIRRIRLSRNELGDLEDILQSIANEEKELRGGR